MIVSEAKPMHASALAIFDPRAARESFGVALSIQHAIGNLAIEALTREVMLAPKPGLVSPADSGSHRDMDLQTFQMSLIALASYFPKMAALGMASAEFEALRECGLAAEERMLAATGGVNTHRGAIFSMGLLAAAAGKLAVKGAQIAADHVCAVVANQYAPSIIKYADAAGTAHSLHVRRIGNLQGARAEACAGFPTALRIGLPAYRFALCETGCDKLAAIQSLFALISRIDDTNLLKRGGEVGLQFAKRRASDFLIRGGVSARDWSSFASRIHEEFVGQNLSPGGSADLLGVTLFLEGLYRLPDATCTSV